MNFDILIVLVVLGAATAAFARDIIAAEVIAMSIPLAFILLGILEPQQAFAGFGSETVVMIFGLLILTAGLDRTGVVEIAGRFLTRSCQDNAKLLLAAVMVAAAVFSAFISNTAATAFFLPLVFGAALRVGESPARYLLPLAFASILSSSVTIISTSTNMVVSELLVRSRMEPLGFFELAPIGIPITIAGLLYMWFVGRRLIPERSSGEVEDFGLRPWLSEAMVVPDSPLVGRTIAESGIAEKLDLMIVRLVRNKKYLAPRPGTVIREGDSLLLEGPREETLKIKELSGLDLKADAKLVDPEIDASDLIVAEGIVMPKSFLIGRTLKGTRFRERYDLQVLGISRAGRIAHHRLSELRIQLGDIMLLQGEPSSMKILETDARVNILGPVPDKRPLLRRAPIAVAIFAAALLLGGLKVVPLAIATLTGALAMFCARCITAEEAFREIEWKVLLLIGSLLSIGPAMEVSGTAAFLAEGLASWAHDANPLWILTALFGMTLVLTQAMSNQGAAVVMIPIALKTAGQLGLNQRPFAMMIAIAASCSFLTPLEPSCLLVYGPGRYQFADFFRVGIGLTLIILVIALILVPIVWPLRS